MTLYFVLPLNRIKSVRLMLAAGLLLLLAVTTWQWRAVLRARYPAARAAEALATTVPWFVLLFASAYVTMANANPGNFSTHPLTRTDALYFTVTVFATVGFGDITAVSQAARLMVTTQMMLDLPVLGLGVRVFVGAVQFARRQAAPGIPPGPTRQRAGAEAATAKRTTPPMAPSSCSCASGPGGDGPHLPGPAGRHASSQGAQRAELGLPRQLGPTAQCMTVPGLWRVAPDTRPVAPA